jgi:hypothetical protein
MKENKPCNLRRRLFKKRNTDGSVSLDEEEDAPANNENVEEAVEEEEADEREEEDEEEALGRASADLPPKRGRRSKPPGTPAISRNETAKYKQTKPYSMGMLC